LIQKLIILIGSAALVACAAPKYTYYFDRYTVPESKAVITGIDTFHHNYQQAFAVNATTPDLVTLQDLPAESKHGLKPILPAANGEKAHEADVRPAKHTKTLPKSTTADNSEPNYGQRFITLGIVSMIIGLLLFPLLFFGLFWIMQGRSMKKAMIAASNKGPEFKAEQLRKDREKWRKTMVGLGIGILATGVFTILLLVLADYLLYG
jgi:hypothetical protein